MSTFEDAPVSESPSVNPLEFVHNVDEIRDVLTTPFGGRNALDLLVYSGMWGDEHPGVVLTNNWNYPIYCNMYDLNLPPEKMHNFRALLNIDGEAWTSLYRFNHWLPHDLYNEQTKGVRSRLSEIDANKIRSLVEPRRHSPKEDPSPLALQRIEAGMPRTVRVLSGILAMKYSRDPQISNGVTQAIAQNEGMALFGLTEEELALAEELYQAGVARA